MNNAIPGDYTDIQKSVKDMGFGRTRESAVITVRGADGSVQMPQLPFLHRGDIFCDSDGNEWEITEAVQHAHYHRRAHQDGGFQETFYWQYKALLKVESRVDPDDF